MVVAAPSDSQQAGVVLIAPLLARVLREWKRARESRLVCHPRAAALSPAPVAAIALAAAYSIQVLRVGLLHHRVFAARYC